MADRVNRKVVLRHPPDGLPKLSDFGIEEEPVAELKVGDPVFGTTLAQTFATLPPMMIEKAGLDNIRTGARVVLCGAMSQYHQMEKVAGPSLYLRLAERNSRMAGFTVTHYRDRFPEARAPLAGWLASGELRLREHVEEGIENLGATLLKLFDGSHTGKLLLKVS